MYLFGLRAAVKKKLLGYFVDLLHLASTYIKLRLYNLGEGEGKLR